MYSWRKAIKRTAKLAGNRLAAAGALFTKMKCSAKKDGTIQVGEDAIKNKTRPKLRKRGAIKVDVTYDSQIRWGTLSFQFGRNSVKIKSRKEGKKERRKEGKKCFSARGRQEKQQHPVLEIRSQSKEITPWRRIISRRPTSRSKKAKRKKEEAVERKGRESFSFFPFLFLLSRTRWY
jgi:hypothetical protein